MDINLIKKRQKEIELEYSKTLFPKRYISDHEYIALQKDVDLYNENQKKLTAEQRAKENKPKDMFIFDDLNEEAKQLLIDANYDIESDPDNILSFYPSKKTELADKVMEARLRKYKK